jgi:hypothetical protein
MLAAKGSMQGAAAADSPPSPFAAHYAAEWRGIRVGVSDLELKEDTIPGHFVYVWRISARGIFRLAYSSDVLQTSWFSMQAGHVRPAKYQGEEGSSVVNLDFDWGSGHARGVSEGKSVDIAIRDGTQDVMSIQVEVMQSLKNGNLPSDFLIVDKDEAKDFAYTTEGAARISTALGDLDTLVVASSRAGSNRVLRMWFAPSLGMVPVQAERTRDGRPEFAMRIRSLQR